MRIHEEDGQALLLALAFLAFFGLVIAAMLTFADASVFSTERLREQRATVYVADGATDAAIQYARLNAAAGVGAFGAVPCMRTPEFSATNTTPDNMRATVTCTSLAAPTDRDRTVQFTTSVNSVVVIVAAVRYVDSSGSSSPDAFVQSWTYCRSSTSCP